MSTLSAGHRCPGCGSHRVERRGLHGWVERALLPRIARHAYRCLECDRRFWDRPHHHQEYAPPRVEDERPRPRWRLEGSPDWRPRVYALIGLAWVGLLVLFFALRALWSAAETLVGTVD